MKVACAVSVLTCVGCGDDKSITQVGDGFGVKTYGSPVPHSPYIVSLLKKTASGGWVTVWHAISFRCEEPVSWNGAILFGAVTDKRQAEGGHVRLLYFSEAIGVVDVTRAVAESAGIIGDLTVRHIEMSRDGLFVKMKFYGGKPFGARIETHKVTTIARTVAEKRKSRTYDGIKIYE